MNSSIAAQKPAVEKKCSVVSGFLFLEDCHGSGSNASDGAELA